jgi:hypothetical protein
VAQAGEEYRLAVAWHGKSVTATTIAPIPVLIDSTVIVANSDNTALDSLLEARFVPRGDQVYALTMKRMYDEIRYGDTVPVHVSFEQGIWQSDRIARRRDAEADGVIRLRTDYRSQIYEGGGPGTTTSDTVVAILYTFDPAFYDYYQTYHNDNNGDGPFSSGGETVAWNVDGDGIGMFIGRAITERRVRP